MVARKLPEDTFREIVGKQRIHSLQVLEVSTEAGTKRFLVGKAMTPIVHFFGRLTGSNHLVRVRRERSLEALLVSRRPIENALGHELILLAKIAEGVPVHKSQLKNQIVFHDHKYGESFEIDWSEFQKIFKED